MLGFIQEQYLGRTRLKVGAPSAAEAVEIAAKRLGHMGAWQTRPNVDQEVFRATEYRDHAQPGDYTFGDYRSEVTRNNDGSGDGARTRPGRSGATLTGNRSAATNRRRLPQR